MNSQKDIGIISTIEVKNIIHETFQDYKKAGMLIAMCYCDWKCLKEQNLDVSLCQNCALSKHNSFKINISDLFNQYISNPITSSIIFGGLEPMLQFNEVLSVIDYFRGHNCYDDIVIYTGYNNDELKDKILLLSNYDNIFLKCGRFIYNDKPIYDKILGVNLSSQNQKGISLVKTH
jgi:hypothetical protein